MCQYHELEEHSWSNVLFGNMVKFSPIFIENPILESVKKENCVKYEHVKLVFIVILHKIWCQKYRFTKKELSKEMALTNLNIFLVSSQGYEDLLIRIIHTIHQFGIRERRIR